MREVFLLVDDNQNVLWSDASDSPVLLPDSRARWEAIWSRRDRIAEIVHSHPVGPLAFSREDETTMAALVSALGKPMTFAVVAPHGIVRRVQRLASDEGPPAPDEVLSGAEPWWAALLRMASGMSRDKARPAVAERSEKEKIP
ncbi:MAG: Mov34/MPN/PAD-1 family protein [Labilithrix sp.]|nr:Mov34/MPN/PAD-1 family protein [Labilithrix sp.]MCW5811369.1 Mov34/MPN/PAD-1 family protein [Labilithrix sp.]